MICVMSDPVFEKAITIRTTAKAKRAIDRVVASVKSSEKVKWKEGGATKEAIINASWLWLDDQPEEFVEGLMARYVPRLEALMRGEEPGPIFGERAPAPKGKRRKNA